MQPLDDPQISAQEAGLRYVTDLIPGIRRQKHGSGFSYISPEGKALRDPKHLERIRKLAIPPAWTKVWICSSPQGHLQATGRDQKGRKQYRYHSRYREARDENKFSRMLDFSTRLPALRRRVDQDLKKPGIPCEKVIATIVRLLETTFIRVGNEEYTQTNHSFGLTTLREKHVEVSGSAIRFHFRGKSGVEHEVELKDPRLARIVKHIRELPGHELFQYVDESGERRAVNSCDVNDYLREALESNFTAKDFRTWAGTLLATQVLVKTEPVGSKTQAKKQVIAAIKQVSERLGNKPSTCRKYYVHPAIVEAYENGSLSGFTNGTSPARKNGRGLHSDEILVRAILQACEKKAASALRSKTGALKKATVRPVNGRINGTLSLARPAPHKSGAKAVEPGRVGRASASQPSLRAA